LETSSGKHQPIQHVAIIMDGNGRWANRKGLPRNEGHRKGVENVEKIVGKAGELGIRYLTLYAFSAENWKRPKLEVDALMSLLESFLKTQRKLLLKNKIKLHTIGRIEELPPSVCKRLRQVKEDTKQFEDNNLVLALNYGARNEVLDAVNRYTTALHEGVESSDDELLWETFRKYLDTAEIPDPELIIRTSGEHRISNFLLMQSAYSEFLFSPVCWPDFSPDLFETALNDYQNRERRFGKTGEQIEQEKVLSLKSSAS
jgi:undecaprenyl diphosphate synthase